MRKVVRYVIQVISKVSNVQTNVISPSYIYKYDSVYINNFKPIHWHTSMLPYPD